VQKSNEYKITDSCKTCSPPKATKEFQGKWQSEKVSHAGAHDAHSVHNLTTLSSSIRSSSTHGPSDLPSCCCCNVCEFVYVCVVCVRMCVYACVFLRWECASLCVHMWVWVCAHMPERVCMLTNMCVYWSLCALHVFINMHVCMCACKFEPVCVHIHVCMCVYVCVRLTFA